MSLELLVRLGARMRQMSPAEFAALRKMIESGEEQPQFLPAVADALLDMTRISEEFNAADERPFPRMVV